MHRTEVVADEALQHRRHPSRQPKPAGNGDHTKRADCVVADEAGAAGLDAPGLRLGDVVEEHRELERLAPRAAVPERLAQVLEDLIAPRRQLPNMVEQQIRSLDCAQAVLPDIEAMRRRLRRGFHRSALGEKDPQRAPAVKDPQARAR